MAPQGPKMLNTANRRLVWVPTIADIKAPTVLEVNAGILLSCLVTRANYQFGITGNEEIKDAADCAKFDSSVPGIATVEAAMDFFRFRNAPDDIAWTTFDGANIAGYLVERTGQIEDGEDQNVVEIATGDELKVASVLTYDQQTIAPSTAGYEKFHQIFGVQEYEPRAVAV